MSIEDGKGDMPGKLITVEGLDGSGKSTQLGLVKRWLELDGYKVFFTEWNSSPLVESATKAAKKRQMLSPTTFALIHGTDFADRYERQIVPLLHAGYLVLSDRYVYTAYARDTVRGCDPVWIRHMYGFARQPDLTLWFKVPVDVSLARAVGRSRNLNYYEAGMDIGFSADRVESYRIFQTKIHETYERMSHEFPFHVIDATKPAGEQQQEFRSLIRERLDLSQYVRPRAPGGASP